MPASSAPPVSVVIATYNWPAYLRNVVASVVNRDYRNVEIIVTDDSRTETSGAAPHPPAVTRSMTRPESR